LLLELEREHPGVKASMLKALSHVVASHLLDARLYAPAEAIGRAAGMPDLAGQVPLSLLRR